MTTGEDAEKQESSCTFWWECKLEQCSGSFKKKQQQQHQKTELLYDPEIPLSGIYLTEENENTNLKRYMHPYIYCSIIYNTQDTETI